ncbi:MAG: pseudaminic acid biosynthesis-associated methylase [Deltaproteobacteria bacterium]|jgi:spore coat polysaccharide biosynthesis protein SpsF|nr:pseudaminic acid biosynthesis-associated methylase [Deltaproteobacteria bacterium]
MTDSYKTEQESFWAGDFGDSYVDRNRDPLRIANRTALFAGIFKRTKNITRVLEFGANIGQNLTAIKNLIPNCAFGAIEINDNAARSLKEMSDVRLFHGSIFDFSAADLGKYDLTLTSGVLIHINPDFLSEVYNRLYECSREYLCIIEYYNPTPVEVNYRGHSERLFKRDFAGELLDRYPDLQLLDYGFQYHRDSNFPLDDANWFLLKKNDKAD